MAVFKRGKKYSYSFYWRGEHIQRSTKQGNPQVARQMEAAYKTALAKGEVGILERKAAPTLPDFAEKFKKGVHTKCAENPSTVQFYESKLARLLEFTPLADTRLDRINEAIIGSYVHHLRQTQSRAA